MHISIEQCMGIYNSVQEFGVAKFTLTEYM